MKVFCGIQARTNSKRFPKKILQNIGPKPVLRWVYDSCVEADRKIRASGIQITTAVVGFSGDEELKAFCDKEGIKAYFPLFAKEDDLISRYLSVMKANDFTHMVRVTADCWQTNPELLCEIVNTLKGVDYVSNTIHRSFMEGLDLQACSFEALKWFDANQLEQREHPFAPFEANEHIRIQFEKKFKFTELVDPRNPWTIRSSIDTKEDLERANKIYDTYEKARPNVGGKIEERPSTGLARHEQ